MTALVTRPNQCCAETTTARLLQTTGPAGYPAGGWLVKADTGRLETSDGFKDCRSASEFQALSRDGGVNFRRKPVAGACSRRESGAVEKAAFLEFLAHFRVYRHIPGAGDETIPQAVIAAAFDAWQKSRSLGPIADWERVEAFLHEVPGQDCSDAFLDWAEDVVENRGWWQSDDWYLRRQVETFRGLVAKHRRLNAEREAIRLRRCEAGRALSNSDLRQRVFERDGYQCRACPAVDDLTVDHVVPVIGGGSDDFDNLQTLCRGCNSSKGRKEAAAWKRREVRS